MLIWLTTGAPGRVIGWTNSHARIQYIGYVEIFNISLDLSAIYLLILVGAELPFV